MLLFAWRAAEQGGVFSPGAVERVVGAAGSRGTGGGRRPRHHALAMAAADPDGRADARHRRTRRRGTRAERSGSLAPRRRPPCMETPGLAAAAERRVALARQQWP